jgi:hypothetical protein
MKPLVIFFNPNFLAEKFALGDDDPDPYDQVVSCCGGFCIPIAKSGFKIPVWNFKI